MNSTDLQALLSDVLLNLYDTKEQDIQLDIPDPKFGDVSTNIALKIAKNISKNPREIAENICEELTIDYAQFSTKDWEMKCNCGAENCKGVVRGVL